MNLLLCLLCGNDQMVLFEAPPEGRWGDLERSATRVSSWRHVRLHGQEEVVALSMQVPRGIGAGDRWGEEVHRDLFIKLPAL